MGINNQPPGYYDAEADDWILEAEKMHVFPLVYSVQVLDDDTNFWESIGYYSVDWDFKDVTVRRRWLFFRRRKSVMFTPLRHVKDVRRQAAKRARDVSRDRRTRIVEHVCDNHTRKDRSRVVWADGKWLDPEE